MPANVHATGVVLGTCGLLIRGPSGAGKSTLAVALVDRWRGRGAFARLIADDQLELRAVTGRLIAAAPPPIAGLVEIYGIGPVPVRHLAAAVVDAVVELVAPAAVERLPQPAMTAICGVSLPFLYTVERSAVVSLPAIEAWLETVGVYDR